jgi:hypothetical protein
MIDDDFSPEEKRLSGLLAGLHAPLSLSRADQIDPAGIRGVRPGRAWPSRLATALATLAVAGAIIGGYFGLRNDLPASQSNATNWRVLSSPSGMTLDSVACITPDTCWGVGSAIEHYNGIQWSVAGSIVPGATLLGVSCVGDGACWAVGDISGPNSSEPLIEEYAGDSWNPIAGPSDVAPTAISGELSAVTCAVAGDCWAVGTDGQEGGAPAQPLVEQYNGASWSFVATPDIAGSAGGKLNAVACPDTNTCWSVGSAGDQPLIERYSGGVWTATTAPPTSLGSVLNSVTCVNAADCWAVGSAGAGNTLQPLVERYTGTWTVVATPPVTAPGGGELEGLACSNSDSCWAVGDLPGAGTLLGGEAAASSSSYASPLLEQYADGRWTISSDPALSGPGALMAIACEATECSAVGTLTARSP